MATRVKMIAGNNRDEVSTNRVSGWAQTIEADITAPGAPLVSQGLARPIHGIDSR